MLKPELFYEDDEKIGYRAFDEKYKIWVISYIPKNKTDYSEIERTLKAICLAQLKKEKQNLKN